MKKKSLIILTILTVALTACGKTTPNVVEEVQTENTKEIVKEEEKNSSNKNNTVNTTTQSSSNDKKEVKEEIVEANLSTVKEEVVVEETQTPVEEPSTDQTPAVEETPTPDSSSANVENIPVVNPNPGVNDGAVYSEPVSPTMTLEQLNPVDVLLDYQAWQQSFDDPALYIDTITVSGNTVIHTVMSTPAGDANWLTNAGSWEQVIYNLGTWDYDYIRAMANDSQEFGQKTGIYPNMLKIIYKSDGTELHRLEYKAQ